MRDLEQSPHAAQACERDGQRAVGAGIAEMRLGDDDDLAWFNALPRQLLPHLLLKRAAQCGDIDKIGVVEALQHGAGARGTQRGESHAERREHARERVNQHRLDAERVGHEAGMLPARAAEGVEHIFRHVVAALDRDGLDRVRHVGNGDPDEAVGDLFRRAPIAKLAGERLEFLAHRVRIEGLILLGPEDAREEIGLELARHDIGVGYGERPVAAIGEGAGIGAGRIGSDAEARGVVMQDRSAARGDRVNQHHWRTHAGACHHALETPLIGAVEMTDIGRGAPHVEADDLGEAGRARGLNRAHHASRRPGQDGVLAPEQIGGCESPGRLHEQEAWSSSPWKGEVGRHRRPGGGQSGAA